MSCASPSAIPSLPSKGTENEPARAVLPRPTYGSTGLVNFQGKLARLLHGPHKLTEFAPVVLRPVHGPAIVTLDPPRTIVSSRDDVPWMYTFSTRAECAIPGSGAVVSLQAYACSPQREPNWAPSLICLGGSLSHPRQSHIERFDVGTEGSENRTENNKPTLYLSTLHARNCANFAMDSAHGVFLAGLGSGTAPCNEGFCHSWIPIDRQIVLSECLLKCCEGSRDSGHQLGTGGVSEAYHFIISIRDVVHNLV